MSLNLPMLLPPGSEWRGTWSGSSGRLGHWIGAGQYYLPYYREVRNFRDLVGSFVLVYLSSRAKCSDGQIQLSWHSGLAYFTGCEMLLNTPYSESPTREGFKSIVVPPLSLNQPPAPILWTGCSLWGASPHEAVERPSRRDGFG